MAENERWQFTFRDAGISVTGACFSLALMRVAADLSYAATVPLAISAGYFVGRGMRDWAIGYVAGVLVFIGSSAFASLFFASR